MNLSFAFLVLSIAQQTPATMDVPKDRFLSRVREEAIPVWSEYMAVAKSCELSYRFESHRLQPNGDIVPNHPNERVLERTYLIMSDFGSCREISNFVNRKGYESHEVYCFNSKYSFELRGQSPEKMVIRNVFHPLPEKDEVSGRIRAAPFGMCNGWMFREKSLYEQVTAANAVIESVRQPDRRYVISFTKAEGKDMSVICRYEVTLNPEKGWRIDAVKSHIPGRMDTIEEMIYDADGFPVPFPNRLIYSETNSKTGERSRSVTTVTRFETRPNRNETDFTLSAYGFPEPVGVVWEKPTPRYVWFLLAAVGFLLLMFGFHRLARRRRSPSPSA